MEDQHNWEVQDSINTFNGSIFKCTKCGTSIGHPNKSWKPNSSATVRYFHEFLSCNQVLVFKIMES